MASLCLQCTSTKDDQSLDPFWKLNVAQEIQLSQYLGKNAENLKPWISDLSCLFLKSTYTQKIEAGNTLTYPLLLIPFPQFSRLTSTTPQCGSSVYRKVTLDIRPHQLKSLSNKWSFFTTAQGLLHNRQYDTWNSGFDVLVSLDKPLYVHVVQSWLYNSTLHPVPLNMTDQVPLNKLEMAASIFLKPVLSFKLYNL